MMLWWWYSVGQDDEGGEDGDGGDGDVKVTFGEANVAKQGTLILEKYFFDFGHMYSYVKLNFRVDLFSCIF